MTVYVRRRGMDDAAPLLGGVGAACLIVGLVFTVLGMASNTDESLADNPAIGSAFNGAATPSAVGVSALPTPSSPFSTPYPNSPSSPPAPNAMAAATPTPDDLFLAGERIFQVNCVQCHGPNGMGDGPGATGLPVQPAVLPFHVPLHQDEEVYRFVSEGFPNLGMPAFRESLSQDEIIQVVRYLRVRFGGASP